MAEARMQIPQTPQGEIKDEVIELENFIQGLETKVKDDINSYEFTSIFDGKSPSPSDIPSYPPKPAATLNMFSQRPLNMWVTHVADAPIRRQAMVYPKDLDESQIDFYKVHPRVLKHSATRLEQLEATNVENVGLTLPTVLPKKIPAASGGNKRKQKKPKQPSGSAP